LVISYCVILSRYLLNSTKSGKTCNDEEGIVCNDEEGTDCNDEEGTDCNDEEGIACNEGTVLFNFSAMLMFRMQLPN
jgi:hypothetical protein